MASGRPDTRIATATCPRKEERRVRNESDRDERSWLLEGVMGGFKHLEDSQTRRAVVDRGLILHDAVGEVLQLDLQRLRLLDLGRPDVARPVTHQQVVDALSVG